MMKLRPKLLFQSTPPRGGRHGRCPYNFIRKSFNPRPRAGGDKLPATTIIDFGGFNPRPRAGGDITDALKFPTDWGFNPRPRAGGDIVNFIRM